LCKVLQYWPQSKRGDRIIARVASIENYKLEVESNHGK
jgi:hypothetical protein